MKLSREFEITSPDRLSLAVKFIQSNARAMIENKTPIRLIVTTAEQKRHAQQNKYLWSAVYKDIADQVWLDGRQFSSEVWHEHFARMFLPLVDIELPNGEIFQKRTSTTDLGVKEFANYVTQIQAYAAQEYGVRFTAYNQ